MQMYVINLVICIINVPVKYLCCMIPSVLLLITFCKIGEEKWKKEKVCIPVCLSKFILGWAALGNGLKTPLHHPPGEGLSSGKASRLAGWWGRRPGPLCSELLVLEEAGIFREGLRQSRRSPYTAVLQPQPPVFTQSIRLGQSCSHPSVPPPAWAHSSLPTLDSVHWLQDRAWPEAESFHCIEIRSFATKATKHVMYR